MYHVYCKRIIFFETRTDIINNSDSEVAAYPYQW